MYWDVAPPQPSLTVTSISTANPAVVTVTAHGLSTGDAVVISGATGDWVALNGLRRITRTGADTFTIAVDTSAFAGNFDGTMVRALVDPTDPTKIVDPNRREPTLLEVYDNLSANGNSLDFYETRVNANSNMIRMDHLPLTLTVTSISKASPAIVTVTGHGLSTGDAVTISGATGDWAALNGTQKITRTGVDTFTIAVDTSAFAGNFDGTMTVPGIPPPAANVPALTLEMLGSAGRAGVNSATTVLGDYQGGQLPPLPDGTVRRTGLAGFEEIDEISIVAAPDEHSIGMPLTIALITHCTLMRYRFAVLSSNPATDTLANIANIRTPQDTTYAAFYFPWIKVFNPLINQDSLIPPTGHVAGIYANTDINRGVFKSPANEVVVGGTSLQFAIRKAEQDGLNPRGVNCLRVFTSRGLRVWGARTCSQNTLWKYINVRRFFLFLGKSIDEGTQWVVFENNDERLWARVKQTITQFLITQWRAGALMGTKQDEAFFVKVDRTTMTQDDIDNGRLIVIIGVAVVKPAEFVIFRLTQFPGGSSVTEG